MPSTDPGPRDHLVTGLLVAELSGLSDDVRLEQPLDPAEAPERLARHAMEDSGGASARTTSPPTTRRSESTTSCASSRATTVRRQRWPSPPGCSTASRDVRRWGTSKRKTFELGTRPFTFLGPVSYVEHRGERPVAFTWRLASPMPEELFELARSVAAA
jgi:hypothetical protein